MLNLTMHSTHFSLWLYGIRHVVKNNSDSDTGNSLLPLHELRFSISNKRSFICTIPQTVFMLHQSCKRKACEINLRESNAVVVCLLGLGFIFSFS